jgi:3-oxoacyl-[acyl-carrier protein] reductase
MENKTMIITAGSFGIGRETVKYLSKKLKKIFVINNKQCDFNIQNIEFFNCDISKYTQVKSVINNIVETNGKSIDFLFSCAGIIEFGTLEESSIELIDQVIDVNLKGCLFMEHQKELLRN